MKPASAIEGKATADIFDLIANCLYDLEPERI
jgi:hypothetical protein